MSKAKIEGPKKLGIIAKIYNLTDAPGIYRGTYCYKNLCFNNATNRSVQTHAQCNFILISI